MAIWNLLRGSKNTCAAMATIMLLLSTNAIAADKITLQLRWLHQFQFAGYYAAKELGFYRDAGLDVTIIEGGPGRIAVSEVLDGNVQYGVGNQEVLLNRLRGKPLVALATVFQHSPAVFMARWDSGIRSPRDLVGRKVMTIGGKADVGLIAMLQNEGLDPKHVKIIKSSFNIEDLLDGKTDAFNTYLTNEPYFMREKGIPFTILSPANYGIDFYSDILFTTEDEVRNHPDRTKRFRDASLRGWEYAMQNQDEIVDIIQNRYGSIKSLDHLRFEANTMYPLVKPGYIDIGFMNPAKWRHMADTYVKQETVKPGYSLQGFIYDPDRIQLERQTFMTRAITIASAIIVIGGILIWNRSLRRTVSVRTEELEKSKTEAETANRAKSDFLAAMSHDLRTPLNAIIGFSEMIEAKIFGPLGSPRYGEYATDIHNSGKLLVSLIDDILDLSKIEAGKYELHEENVDVAALAQSSIDMISAMSVAGNIQLSTNIEPSIPLLHGDKRTLTQVFNNLLSNAVKFTPEEGNITISAKSNSDDAIEVRVTDTGIGMSRNDIATAIKPFEQADSALSRRHEGTGLGLHLCQKFMDLHGGTFDIESKVDIGTTISICFPPERTVHLV